MSYIVKTTDEINLFLADIGKMQGASDIHDLIIDGRYQYIEVLGKKSFAIVFNEHFEMQNSNGEYISRIASVRVSTDTQKEAGYGVSMQMESIIKYCQMKQYNLCAVAFDLGITGDNHKELISLYDSDVPVKNWFKDIRPGIHYALSHLSPNNKLLCTEPSRAWRDNDMTGSQVRFATIARGSDLEFVNMPTITLYEEEPASYFSMMINFNIADFDKKSLVKRMREGRMKRAKAGKTMTKGRMYGYVKHEDGTLTVNEPEAKIVREIFRLYNEHGKHWQKIAHQLNQNHMLDRGGKQWSNYAVRDIYNMPIYRGWYEWGTTSTFHPELVIVQDDAS